VVATKKKIKGPFSVALVKVPLDAEFASKLPPARRKAVKGQEHIVLLMGNEGGSVRAFAHEVDAVRYFEDAYNYAHVRGYEPSMSACINWLFIQPSIVTFKTQAELKKLVERPVISVTFNCVAGGGEGLMVKRSAWKLWDKGVKPRLIGCGG
jgi:hypothetical protein